MGAVVTMHVWRVAPHRVPSALRAVVLDRRRVRALTGVRFAKLLGTGQGFSVRHADPTRWALLVSWTGSDAARAFDDTAIPRRWRARSRETWQAVLRPLASHGRWSRREPFDAPRATHWDGPVAAITRARLVARRAVAFWRAVPAVAADLDRRDGLRAAFGIGEAPLGVQGTFTIWTDAPALQAFAYQGDAHSRAIRETVTRRWYAEELFARFGVVSATGTLDTRDPLAGLR